MLNLAKSEEIKLTKLSKQVSNYTVRLHKKGCSRWRTEAHENFIRPANRSMFKIKFCNKMHNLFIVVPKLNLVVPPLLQWALSGAMDFRQSNLLPVCIFLGKVRLAELDGTEVCPGGRSRGPGLSVEIF